MKNLKNNIKFGIQNIFAYFKKNLWGIIFRFIPSLFLLGFFALKNSYTISLFITQNIILFFLLIFYNYNKLIIKKIFIISINVLGNLLICFFILFTVTLPCGGVIELIFGHLFPFQFLGIEISVIGIYYFIFILFLVIYLLRMIIFHRLENKWIGWNIHEFYIVSYINPLSEFNEFQKSKKNEILSFDKHVVIYILLLFSIILITINLNGIYILIDAYRPEILRGDRQLLIIQRVKFFEHFGETYRAIEYLRQYWQSTNLALIFLISFLILIFQMVILDVSWNKIKNTFDPMDITGLYFLSVCYYFMSNMHNSYIIHKSLYMQTALSGNLEVASLIYIKLVTFFLINFIALFLTAFSSNSKAVKVFGCFIGIILLNVNFISLDEFICYYAIIIGTSSNLLELFQNEISIFG